MFITFRCPCNRKLVVKQEFAGKRCVCPDCGVKNVVPEHSMEEPAPRPAKVARPAAPAPETRTQVTPRKRPVVDEDEAPRRRPMADADEAPRKRRPADEDEAPRRRPVTAFSDAPRKRAVPAVDVDDADEADDEDPRPRRGAKARRKSGGSGVLILVIVLVVGGLFLLTGTGFAVWYFGFRSSSKTTEEASSSSSKGDNKSSGGSEGSGSSVALDEDIKKVPDDAVAFASFDAVSFWGTDIGKQVLPMIQGFVPQLADLGMQVTDFRRLTLIAGANPDKQICVVVSCRQPLPPQALSALEGPKFPRIQYQGKTYLKVDDKRNGAGTAMLLLPDNRTVLMGPVEGVHWIATAPPGTDKSPLASARPLASKHLLAGALNMQEPKIQQSLVNAPPEMKQKAGNLIQVRTVIATVDLSSEVRVHLSLKMPNETVARAALAEANALRSEGMQEISKMKQQGGPPQAGQMMATLESVVQGIKIAQVGDTINVDVVAPTNLGGGLADLLGPGGFPFPGGNAPQASRTSNDLKQLVIAYHNYLASNNNKPPQKPEDLLPYIENDQRLLTAMKSGQLVFLFGVSTKDMVAGTVNTVLVYERDVTTKGGFVGMADGTVRKMTPDEFRRATLAKRR
jgi:hypothetical protein